MKCKTQPVDAKDAYIAGQFDGMKINLTCPRCGENNPAEIHTCTPKQDQPIDLNPIGYLIWEAGGGWWEFVEEEPLDYFDYKAVYAGPVVKKPMDGDEILEGFKPLGFSVKNFRLRCFTEGVRWAEKMHGIGGEYD